MKAIWELMVELFLNLILKEGLHFIMDVLLGRVSMELFILAVINLIIISIFFIKDEMKEKKNVISKLLAGLFIGMLVIFTVMAVFQIIYFIMNELFGLTVQPNNRETKRWYALVNAVMIMISPLVWLSKKKSPWMRRFLSLINILFFLVVFWVVSFLWKPEVQVDLEIQLAMSISLTLGVYLWFSPTGSKGEKKEIVDTEKAEIEEKAAR